MKDTPESPRFSRCDTCMARSVTDEGWRATFECGAEVYWTDDGREVEKPCPREDTDWVVAQALRLDAAGDREAADVIRRLILEVRARDEIRLVQLQLAAEKKSGNIHRSIGWAKHEAQRLAGHIAEARWGEALVTLGVDGERPQSHSAED